MKNNGSIGLCKAVAVASIGLACWQMDAATTTNLGNGGIGFGGALGTGSLTLMDNGTTISGTFTRGAGNHTDALVLYIDSIPGGLLTTSMMDDQADLNRRSISGVGGFGRSTVNFAADFESDFAISLYNNTSAMDPQDRFEFGGLWGTVNGGTNSLPFVGLVNLSGGGNSALSYTFDFNLTQIGLTPNNGDTFRFVATYTSGSGFRSNEAIGASDAPPGANNIGVGTLNFNGFESYTTVPEPASYVLLGLGALGLIFHLRRRHL